MKGTLKLIDAVVNGDIIVWTQRTKETNGGDNKHTTRKERIKDVVRKVNNGRQELEKDRNGIEITPITFGLNYEEGEVARLQNELTQVVKISKRSSSSVEVTIRDKAAIKRGVQISITNPRKKVLELGNKRFILQA